jgi:hypothetical protein
MRGLVRGCFLGAAGGRCFATFRSVFESSASNCPGNPGLAVAEIAAAAFLSPNVLVVTKPLSSSSLGYASGGAMANWTAEAAAALGWGAGFGFWAWAGAGEAYCIVSALWEYALAARPLAAKSLFHVPGINWTLKACHLSERLKRLGAHFGLDTHSLRIGGASTLAAAGLSDSKIQRMGDWRSTSFLRYLRLNLQLFQKARVALSTGTVLTVDDVCRVYGRQGEQQV